MRLIIVFLFFSISLKAQFFAPIYSNTVSKNNLIVDYDFQNAISFSGTEASVASANGKNVPAILNGSPAFFADPGYVQFKPASENYLMIGDLKNFYPQVTSSTRSGVFSLSIWFNPSAQNGNIVSDLWSSAISYGYHTSNIEMVAGYLKFTVWPRTTVITTATTVSLNSWHHIVLVYNGSNINAYLDGALVGTATYTRIGPAMGSLTTGQYFGIGAYETTNLGSGAYGSFLLGNVKFYASALSTADVSNLYLAEEPNYDLLFMVDGSKNNLTYPDIAGLGTTATNRTGVSYTSTGGSLYFNGTATGYTDFTFPLKGATTITVEMWVYPTALSGGMFFGFYNYDVYTYNNAIGFNTAVGDVYGLTATQTSGCLNNWKHYVFVMKAGSVTNNKIYLNGVNQTLSQILGSPENANASFSNGVGRIGSWGINTNYIQPMYVTKFKIYNRELNQSEITSKFNKDKSRYGL